MCFVSGLMVDMFVMIWGLVLEFVAMILGLVLVVCVGIGGLGLELIVVISGPDLDFPYDFEAGSCLKCLLLLRGWFFKCLV